MDNELISIIENIKENFNIEDIESYQTLLLIIYNSIFLDEDQLESNVKYKIFETLSNIISKIENYHLINKHQELETEILYDMLVPTHLQQEYHQKHRYANTKWESNYRKVNKK